MSQKKAKARRRQEQEAMQQRNNKNSSILHKLFSWSWKVFGVFAVLLGVYSVLRPTISVSPSTYLNPSAPLTALFEVTNSGYIPLFNVKPSCAVTKAVAASGKTITGVPNYGSRFVDKRHFAKELSPGETVTVQCALAIIDMKSPIVAADIAIVVDYSFLGIKWPGKIYPFTTQIDIKGQLHWIKHPLNK